MAKELVVRLAEARKDKIDFGIESVGTELRTPPRECPRISTRFASLNPLVESSDLPLEDRMRCCQYPIIYD